MNIEKLHDLKDLDVGNAARGVWLVKVPKYLSEKWNSCGGGDVGKLTISKPRLPGGKPEVIFTLNDEMLARSNSDVAQIPKDHKFVLTGVASQSLSVLARENIESPNGDLINEKITVEGKVIQRAECRPMGDQKYMSLKKTQFHISNNPVSQIKQLDKAVQNYKPVSMHVHDVKYEQKKKEEGKRSRMDKDKVMEILFDAFEKHQYYNVKDLVTRTQQPVTYLKEILKEICNYNMKAPHRNMWELKPEYRHYKSSDKT